MLIFNSVPTAVRQTSQSNVGASGQAVTLIGNVVQQQPQQQKYVIVQRPTTPQATSVGGNAVSSITSNVSGLPGLTSTTSGTSGVVKFQQPNTIQVSRFSILST